MVRRWLTRALLLAGMVGLLTGGCGTPAMSHDEATRVAVHAFEKAGLAPKIVTVIPSATVDQAHDGSSITVHQVELDLDGRSYRTGVDRRAGAVVRLDEPADTVLTKAQVHTIAAYRENPAADRAGTRRNTTVAVLLGALLLAAYLSFRRARLRSEALARLADEIPL